MTKHWALIMAMGAAGCASVATAQAPSPTPVASASSPATPPCSGPSITSPDGTVRCIPFETRLSIRVYGFADRWGSGAPRDWVRWPEALTPPASWISESDAAVQAWLAMPSPRNSRSLDFLLSVGADGQMADCVLDRNYGFGASVPPPFLGLCETVRRTARIRRALDANGQPVASRYRLSLIFDEQRLPVSVPPPPLIQDHMPSPAPPPPPPPGPPEWPPRWLSGPLPTAGTLPLLDGGAAAIGREAPGWVGVTLTAAPDGRRACTVVRPSSDARFDRRACDAATRDGALTYVWPDAARAYPARTPIHFVPVGGRPRAILPVAAEIVGARISPGARGAIAARMLLASGQDPASPPADVAALRLSASVDAAGRVTRCEVTASSGNDAADGAACAALRASDGIEPGHDIFGWPIATGVYGMAISEAAP